MASAFGSAAEPVVVDVWSDVVCPFCYLGDAHLKEALKDFPQASSVQIRYHSFQLHPDALKTMPVGDYLKTKVGVPLEQLQASQSQIAARGAELGLDYHFEHQLVTNTRDAHRLIHFAKAQGREHDMVMRLFRAEFTEGADVSDHDLLANLAEEAGLDRAKALEVLGSDAYESDFRADIEQAQALGISGVPFFVFDGKRAVSGAQPVELFRRALDLSWQDRAAG
ncbi:DsbA family oxidoreductase [Kineosporia succinea]|uniref:DsbA family dithiol-disulfide isomerase n=1 Tax=Kineosporia succinea TaxID=84632 RepID=A0ABT9PBT2_9ACTN|nr:DsbA family oxidoreductase [Kineosporia succinea]MDP9830155.1 putative DsbA family dithiol-disulfide isomerase [Kineosporia succinea]